MRKLFDCEFRFREFADNKESRRAATNRNLTETHGDGESNTSECGSDKFTTETAYTVPPKAVRGEEAETTPPVRHPRLPEPSTVGR
jgi:hypothetical protein